MTDAAAFAGQTVFITGASGVVGSWLVQSLLGADASLVALVRDEDPSSEFMRSGDHQRVITVRGDLEDLALLERALVQYEVDVIYHLGAQTQVRHAQRQPHQTLESNVRGAYNLLEAARRMSRPVRALVMASSDKAYGESIDLPYTETHPLAGRSVYDASKGAADLLSSAFAASYGMPVGIARCANVYGGGDLNWDRIVPGTIRSLLRGEPPVVRSDGTLLRDYLFVGDAVTGYLALGAALMDGRESGEAFNFGTGEPIAVLDVVAEVSRAVRRTDLTPIVQSDAANEISSQWLDATKARARLGWEPSVDLPTGLAKTVPWYRAVLD